MKKRGTPSGRDLGLRKYTEMSAHTPYGVVTCFIAGDDWENPGLGDEDGRKPGVSETIFCDVHFS